MFFKSKASSCLSSLFYSVTKGSGTSEHPSTPIATYNFKGNPKPTNAIPFGKTEALPPSKVKAEIPGSTDFFKDPSIKDQIDFLSKPKIKDE